MAGSRTVWERVGLLVAGVVLAILLAGIVAAVRFERAFAADYARLRAQAAATADQSNRVFVYLTTPIDAHGTSRAAVIDAAVAQAQTAAVPTTVKK